MIRNLLFWLVLLPALAATLPATGQEPVAFGRSEVTIETGAGKQHFRVEVATSEKQKSHGLMFRSEMAPDAGMLFVYGSPQVVTMWMRNTLIPLDMLFIGPDGRIAHIAARAVPRSEKTISSRARVVGVLELNGGTARRLGIAVGDRVVSPALATTD